MTTQLHEPEVEELITARTGPNPSLGNILVVDDEPELKTILVESIRKQGYEVTGCSSAVKALAAMREQNFDLLLTDLMMPEMDGIALLRATLEIDPHVVAIMMTGQGTIQTAVDAMKLGAFDYVLKPFRMQMLMPVLTRAMNVRHLRLENVHLRETVAIYGLSQTIAFTLDPQTVLSKLADAALEQSNADEVSILLPTQDGKELYVAMVRGEKRERLLGERIPLENSIASWMARERTPLILNGEVRDDRFISLWPRADIRSAISVPMQVANKLVGIINLNVTSHLRPFTLGQMKALTILAGTAASALESASLYTQVQEAEKNYRSIFENAVEGIFRLAPDGRFLVVNPALANILGYDSPQEVVDSFTDIGEQLYVDPAFPTQVTQTLKERKVLLDFEFEAYRKGGQKIWLSQNIRILRDEKGLEVGREGTIEDITQRKRATEALRESEARNRGILESSMDCVITMDHEGLIVDWNPAAEKTFGYSQKETIGRKMAEIIIPERYRERHNQGLKRYLATGEGRVLGQRLQLSAQRRDNTEFPVELTITRMESRGKPMFTGYLRDITETKKAENRLSVQYAVTRALAESNTLSEGASKILQAVCEGVEWEYGCLWTVDRTSNTLGCSQIWSTPGPGAEEFESASRQSVFTPGIGLPGRVWANNQPAWIVEVAEDTNFPRSAIAAGAGLHSACAFPIRLRSEILAVVEFFSRSIREPDPDLLAMMLTIGSQIGQFIERKRVEEALIESEEQLRQSQKLEAMGQLAGGVAHDFNNLLTVIGGYSSILLNKLPQDSPHRSSVEEIKKAGDRAAALTRQLLAFSRKQILQPKVLDLNVAVADMEKMLRRLIGEDIDLLTISTPVLGKVKADPGQIEQVLLNLIVNSRDAMPKGGKLTIETRNVVHSEEYALRHAALAGPYVMLAVSDTGCGMDAAIQPRVFDPFFTTKASGQGTGLGLATVYGIVKQSGGNIWFYSEVGHGSTFKIYLPRVDESSEEEAVVSSSLPKGTELILLVEDEDQVRAILKQILEGQGYQVLEASNGEEALSLSLDLERDIRLIITDVVMPQISGRELAERVLAIRPNLPVLFMSGYTDDAIVRHGLLDETLNFIQKPFDSPTMARKVREVLDKA
ncbi:MAG: response regulator [Pyrinomonadaceae bacterium]